MENWKIIRKGSASVVALWLLHALTGSLSAESVAIADLEVNAEFRPAIVRIALDRENVCAGKSVQIRMDWHTKATTGRDYQLSLNLVSIGRPPDFNTNLVLSPPTSHWAAGDLVRQEAFTVTIPANLSPGWRRLLFSLAEPGAPDRPIPLDNADRLERNSQYCFGEIEILPPGSDAPDKPVVRLPTNDPAKPERPNEEWRLRHGERVAEVQSHSNALDVLFIGDSITGGWLNIGKAVWEKELVPLGAVNIGIAGSQTSHILWQFEHGAIDGINPCVAVFMIGVNNVMAAPSQSAADIARGISTIVANLRKKLPHTKVLLLGTFPKDRSPTSSDRRKIQEINMPIAKLDDGRNIRYCDLTAKFLGADGTLSAEISPDGVHLSLAGYAIWAEALRPILREMTAQRPSQAVPPPEEALILSSPLDYQVVQRQTTTAGTFRLQGKTAFIAAKWQYRLLGKPLSGPADEAWHDLPSPIKEGALEVTVCAPAGGWYRLEVRGLGAAQAAVEASVAHVGVGEVFIVAGQSNAGNHGAEKQTTRTGQVSSFNGAQWVRANDPQPGASGREGSFMPVFGDAMSDRFHVPIGIVAIAQGATSVREWLPKGARMRQQPTTGANVTPVGPGEWASNGALFDLLVNRFASLGPRGCRAVLWHQGESDAGQARAGYPKDRQITGDQYFGFMRDLLNASREKAGWPLPWFTAQTTYHSEQDASDPEFRSAMQQLWDQGLSLPGPDTDTLRAEYRAGVHFNSQGLRQHGQMWADRVGAWLEKQIAAEGATAASTPAGGDRASTPRPASPEQMQWFREAKFGLFIHWGPASISGAEISWGRKDRLEAGGQELQKVPAEVYDHLYQQFNPVKFNADQWMALAQEAGCRYVVLVTKHHDGFSLWPTDQVRWNDPARPRHYSIADTPYQRDLCREIAEAAHQHGLRLGWYYSTRDWTHPDYLKGDNRIYNAYYEAQVRELLTRYGPVDIMWFDHAFGDWSEFTIEHLFQMMYRAQPNLLVNNRSARGLQHLPAGAMRQLTDADYDTPEQQIGHFQTNRAWESCMTITKCRNDTGGWSYRPGEPTRSYEECLKMLLSTVTGDGNLLLNVGPTPAGEILPEQVEVLKKIGAWLKQHGQSIYGTRGGPIPNGNWGGSTQRGNKVWLHVFQWSEDALRLPPLASVIQSALTLDGHQAKATQTPSGLEITLPRAQQDPVDTVIELTLAALPAR